MKPEQITLALEAAAGQLGVRVRYEPLTAGSPSAGGGLCRIRGEWCVLIDKKSSMAERAAILIDALAGLDTEAVYLPPKVRDAVQARRAALAAGRPSVSE